MYEATLSSIDHPFAIKLLDPTPFQPAGSKSLERFLQEAKILFALRHQYIVPIYGVGVFEEKPYILMERFDGFNLNEARERMVPTPETALNFVRYVAEGLSHAHVQGVVHRDINPSNLMTIQGDARILDFGIAAIVDPKGTRFTRTGNEPVGDAFSAPELLDNRKLIDPRSDIYSLGACWLWLLTGQAPKGRGWESALRGIDGLSREYEQVVLKTLEPLQSRYTSMDEVLAEINVLRTGDQRPKVSLAEVDATANLILGIVFEKNFETEPVTTFEIERQMGDAYSRFQINIALRKLGKLALLDLTEDSDWNGNSYTAFKLSTTGCRG